MSTTGFFLAETDKNIDKGEPYEVTVAFANNSGGATNSSTNLSFAPDLPTVSVTVSNVSDGSVATVTKSLPTDNVDPGLYKPYLTSNVIEYATSNTTSDGGHIERSGLNDAIVDANNSVISSDTLSSLTTAYHRSQRVSIQKSKQYNFIDGDAPLSAQVGDVMRWSVQVERIGDSEALAGVKLSIGNDIAIETGNVDIDKGQTDTVEVSAIATEDMVGSTSWEISIGSESVTGIVSISSAPEPDISLSIDSINTPDIDGILSVDGHIVNDKETQITNETVRLTVSGSVVATIDKTVSAKSQDDFSFDVDLSTYSFPVGESLIQIDSVDTAGVVRNGTVDITADPSYTIVSVNGPSNGKEGDIYSWIVTVENNGDGFDTKSLSLDIAGNTIRADSVEILPGNTRSFTIDVALKNIGDISWTVSIDGNSSTGTVNVSDVPDSNLQILINSVSQPVEGEDLIVEATVTNQKDVSDSDTIQLLLPTTTQSVDDQKSVSVPANGEENIQLNYTTTSDEVGNLSFQVITEDQPVVRNISTEVGGNPQYSINNVDFPAESNLGSFANFDVTIENTGSSSDQRFLFFDWEGTGNIVDQEEAISVPVNETEEKRITFRIPEEFGTFNFTISTDYDSFTNSVNVDFSPVVTLQATDVGFEEAKFSGEVIRSGEAQNFTVGFQVRRADSQDATPNKIIAQQNANSVEQFSVEFDRLSSDTEYEFRSFFDIGEKTYYGDYVTFSTQPVGPIFNIEVTNIRQEVEEIEEFGIEVLLENSGISAETTLTLFVDNVVEDNIDTQIQENSSKRERLFWNTDIGDAGFSDVRVETRNTTF